MAHYVINKYTMQLHIRTVVLVTTMAIRTLCLLNIAVDLSTENSETNM